MDDQLKEVNGKTIGSLQKGFDMMFDEIKKIKGDQIEMIKATSRLTQALDSVSESLKEWTKEIKDHGVRLVILEKETEFSEKEKSNVRKSLEISKTNMLAWIAIAIAAIPAIIQIFQFLKKVMQM